MIGLGLAKKALDTGLEFFGLNKLKLMIGLGVAILLACIYFQWKHSIRTEALMEYNANQLEQVAKDQKAFQKKLEEVAKAQDQMTKNQDNFKKSLDGSLVGLTTFLNSAEAKKMDKPASDLLKRTLEEMHKAKEQLK